MAVVPELVVEQCYDRNDDERRYDRCNGTYESTCKSFHPIPYHDRCIYRQGSGSGLCNRGHIQHLIFRNPVKLLNKFFTHHCDDDESSAKGTGTYDQIGHK